MLEPISWKNYVEGSAVVLAAYYAGVGLIYFRKEISALIRPRSLSATAIQDRPATGNDAEGTPSLEALESSVRQIDSILEQAGKGVSKDQLLAQLKKELTNYGGLRIPAYRVAVFNHIIKQADELCGIGISADELEEARKRPIP